MRKERKQLKIVLVFTFLFSVKKNRISFCSRIYKQAFKMIPVNLAPVV